MLAMPDDPRDPWLTLLVAHPHRAFAEALAGRLAQEEGVATVEVAFTTSVIPAVANKVRPDVLLLDAGLTGNRLDSLVAVLSRLPFPPRVLLIAPGDQDDPDEVARVLEEGAHGWIARESSLEALTEAVGALARGHLWLPEQVLDRLIPHLLKQRSGAPLLQGFLADLSPRELEVLQCLMSAMTRAEVAQMLFISPNTVRTHVQRLLKASGEHSTPALVAAARRLGLRPRKVEEADWSDRRRHSHP